MKTYPVLLLGALIAPDIALISVAPGATFPGRKPKPSPTIFWKRWG